MIAAVVQICARQDIDDNLARCAELVTRAAARGAKLIVLPENFAYIGSLKTKLQCAETVDQASSGPILGLMRALAKRLGCTLILGGLPERSPDPARFYNTAVVVDDKGTIESSYRKMHLFDIAIPGGAEYRESAYVVAGPAEPHLTKVYDIPLGVSTCYDLRFPELYRRQRINGAEILALGAAFTMHTGRDHWIPLLRARAIENQAFVLAAGQWGRHNASRESYGRSCIIDGWGTLLACCADQDDIAVAELDLGTLRRQREQLPCIGHRRLSSGPDDDR
ncbi:MAG: carbon-nitrogen hydrolase family protein [Deltaproteobacteria bacterium]|nr:carbon-nitrogen hydrolase family protein [Deltaproteobacteria bacterium]